ncbi:MAG: hypothetical protein ACHBN1_34035 [Heteroscytonema crispum UTEX LB 1556]
MACKRLCRVSQRNPTSEAFGFDKQERGLLYIDSDYQTDKLLFIGLMLLLAIFRRYDFKIPSSV